MPMIDDESREIADVETSSGEYARRFASPAGIWMLAVQERITVRLLASPPDGATLLDVGGGHAQLAPTLARRGWRVTVFGSTPECAARLGPELNAGQLSFAAGNLLALPFPDRSFEITLAIRLLPHCRRWPLLIAELCRVARTTVLVDYPTSQSLNCFSAALFEAKKKVEKNTRPFTLFRHAEVTAEFARCGFALRERQGQFFLPMVLHRMLNTPRLSTSLEWICRRTGFTRLFGSPVLARYERILSGNR